jgi:WD40 repeat protein
MQAHKVLRVKRRARLVEVLNRERLALRMPRRSIQPLRPDAPRPSITADGLEIFFHSNRVGTAGFDMFKAARKSVLDPWSMPETLGTDVNTIANDFLGAISPDGETLLFTSNRDSGFGQNDIYVTTRSSHGRH